MTKLILTRGIPASGKTTYAKQWVSMAPKRFRINRDDLRFSMYGLYFGDPIDENDVTTVQHAMIASALKAGISVIVDDTNLNARFAKKLIALGHRHGADVEVIDFDIDLAEAIRRNDIRSETEGRHVPNEVIKKFYGNMKSRVALDTTPPAISPYSGTPGQPKAVIVDIDGTLATMKGRSPYEWQRVGEDKIVENVKDTVDALWVHGYKIIILSGRDGECYDITENWLIENAVPYDYFWMRAAGDQRPDNIVKAELFDNHIRDNFDVKFVIDDRDQVVDMWRRMGLQCFQVAPGEF